MENRNAPKESDWPEITPEFWGRHDQTSCDIPPIIDSFEVEGNKVVNKKSFSKLMFEISETDSNDAVVEHPALNQYDYDQIESDIQNGKFASEVKATMSENAENSQDNRPDLVNSLTQRNDIFAVGNCANCGVEYHIHAQANNGRSIREEITNGDLRVKINTAFFDCWESAQSDPSYFNENKAAEKVLRLFEYFAPPLQPNDNTFVGSENPIINNRIVNDHTFATRLKSFLHDVSTNDACASESLDYLQTVADKLLKYQLETCPDNELWYHKNCGNI